MANEALEKTRERDLDCYGTASDKERRILDLYSPDERANYFANAGYDAD